MVDITTGTGDFIADGVVSHNCFARPTHDYLGLNIGEDFERKIVVKVNAVERLRVELRSPKWHGDPIAMGTNTDPYQRCEGKYRLTRGIIEALGEAANPFSILTKSTLILRDLDVLTAAAARTDVHTSFSIGTLDDEVWRMTEPGTPRPRQRIEAVRKLNNAGIPCGADRRGGRGVRRRRCDVDRRDRAAPPPRCARALHGLARRRATRPAAALPRALRYALVPTEGGATRDQSRRRRRARPHTAGATASLVPHVTRAGRPRTSAGRHRSARAADAALLTPSRRQLPGQQRRRTPIEQQAGVITRPERGGRTRFGDRAFEGAADRRRLA